MTAAALSNLDTDKLDKSTLISALEPLVLKYGTKYVDTGDEEDYYDENLQAYILYRSRASTLGIDIETETFVINVTVNRYFEGDILESNSGIMLLDAWRASQHNEAVFEVRVGLYLGEFDVIDGSLIMSRNLASYSDITTLNTKLSDKLDNAKLQPILKEIDLTGTDAERKAKLDQFEKDWKALTGSDTLEGARFVGMLNPTKSSTTYCALSYSTGFSRYEGISSDADDVPYKVLVNIDDGSLTITPLFQHLEAVVLRISDGDSNADTVNAANKTSIENYVANLQSLGVSIEGTPCHFILLKYKNGNYTNYTVNVGILRLTEKYSQYDFWIDGVKGGVDYETGKVTISSNLNTTLEAITIYTDNTEEHMQMNLDNIAAYESNLQALGVDTTKSPMIGVILTDEYYNPIGNGCIQYDPIEEAHIGYASQLNGDGYAETFTFKVDVSGFAYITKLAPESAVVSKSLNAKSLEAVTIKTSNSDTDKAANVAAINAYVNNLKSLGVDVTKGYYIPFREEAGIRGFLIYNPASLVYTILGASGDQLLCIGYMDGGHVLYVTPVQLQKDTNLTTTSKQIVGAINEVNAAVKTKAANIKDASSTGGINQAFDGGETLDVTGKNPNATALDSTITGALTRGATGQYASSFGGKSIAIGKRSFAEGTTTIAKGNYSHAEGDNSVALGSDSHVEGYQTTTGPAAMGAHAEGNGTQSLGAASHSEGSSTIAKGNTSHAEGADTKANGISAHTEGNGTKGDGNYSHAEGNGTSAIGDSSHAEGYITIAQGDMSHAEGALTKAIGNHSHTEGSNNTANAGNSHAEGANNTVNNSKYTAPSGGSSGSTGSTEPSEPADFNIEEHYGEGGHAEGMYNNAYGYASHAEGAHNKSKAHYSHTEGQGNDASGEGSHAEGWSTVASGVHSHSEGHKTTAKGENSHAEGFNTTASINAHAEGDSTAANASGSHAEGHLTNASSSNSHAEGVNTKSGGDGSHAEGHYSETTNNAAHAEGVYSMANGDGSHAEGWHTTTTNRAEHAEGYYNISHSVDAINFGSSGNTLHSVGIGTDSRRNAFEIMQNGDIYAYGIGGYDGTNPTSSNSKTLKQVIEYASYLASQHPTISSAVTTGTTYILTKNDDTWSGTIGRQSKISTDGNYLYCASDEKLKEIQSEKLDFSLEDLSKIRKVEFNWKDDESKEKHIGTIAQDVEKLFPELVTENSEGYKSVSYDALSVVALAAIDKLQEKYDTKIKKLEAKIKKLEKQLNA